MLLASLAGGAALDLQGGEEQGEEEEEEEEDEEEDEVGFMRRCG